MSEAEFLVSYRALPPDRQKAISRFINRVTGGVVFETAAWGLLLE